MLRTFRFENFQSFTEPNAVELAPITLIFGPNSSGKSAILRALRLASQAIAQSNSLRPIEFSATGPLIDLTSYANLIHNHETERNLTMEFEIRTESADDIVTGVRYELNKDFEVVEFSLRISYDFDHLTDQADPNSYRWNDDGNWWLTFESVSPSRSDQDDVPDEEDWYSQSQRRRRYYRIHPKQRHDFASVLRQFETDPSLKKLSEPRLRASATSKIPEGEADLAKLRFSLAGPGPKIPFSDFGKTGLRIFQERVDRFNRQLLATTRALTHVGPLRVIPEKVFQIRDKGGSSTPYHLGSALARDKRALEACSSWLSELTGGDYELHYSQFASTDSVFLGQFGSLLLRHRSGNLVTFEDAGTGLSQILEVIEKVTRFTPSRHNPRVSGAYTHDSGLVLIEQPELHLHPKMQSEVADLFVSVTNANPDLQIIAETHSENLILRIQKLIRMKRVDSSQVSIIFVGPDVSIQDSEITIRDFEITVNGEFAEQWPISFSQLRLDESMGGKK